MKFLRGIAINSLIRLSVIKKNHDAYHELAKGTYHQLNYINGFTLEHGLGLQPI